MSGYVFGGGSGGGGGAPTGSAGGDLSGTYPNPTVATVGGHTAVTTSDTGTVTSAMIADGTIVTGDLSATAGITSGQLAGSIAYSKLSLTGAILNADLAGSIAASKITGTAVTQADSRTVTSGMLAVGATGLSNVWKLGAHTFATPCHPMLMSGTTGTVSATNAARTCRVRMPETGAIRDLSVYVLVTGGNGKLMVYDTGQANTGDHTVRTHLADSGAIATPAANAWMTWDANLAVNEGDELEFVVAFDGTTAGVACLTGYGANAPQLPSSSFMPPSGTGTALPKLTAAPTSMYTSPPATVTDANWTLTNSGKIPIFVWRMA